MGVQSLFGEGEKNRESRERTDNPEQERERWEGGRERGPETIVKKNNLWVYGRKVFAQMSVKVDFKVEARIVQHVTIVYRTKHGHTEVIGRSTELALWRTSS